MRNDKTSRKAGRAQRRKRATSKHGNAPAGARCRNSLAGSEKADVALLKLERDEALVHQRATSEVLRAISNATTDAASTLGTIAESVVRLLDVTDAEIIMRIEGDLLKSVAKYGSSPNWPMGTTRTLSREWVSGRAVMDRTAVHVADLQAAELEFPLGASFAHQYGHRTTLAVPLLREGSAIGAILIRRMEMKPFTERQIELVSNFASQAVIAIENARLFDEVQARTRDLSEALQQQTATADVLKVISRSTFDLQAVLDTLVASACHLCEADIGTIRYQDGSDYLLAATYGFTPEWRDHFARYSGKPDRGSVFGRTIVEGGIVHIPDVLADPEFARPEAQKLMGLRAALGVPLVREGRVFGVLSLLRLTPRPFTQKQIELVSTFADQAVIAIENARLFNEVQTRTLELTEALEQQTATSEVLSVISSSAGDLAPVFDAMLAKAMQLCSANFGVLNTYDGKLFHTAATYGLPPAYDEYRRSRPLDYGSGTAPARLLQGEPVVEINDLPESEAYRRGDANRRTLVDIGGARALLAVPLLKDERVVGNVMIFRQEKRPFSEKQITLLKQFAAQAVIAIENTRLLRELRESTEDLSESLQQQTATADVLKVISRSAFDLQTVLDTLVESAARLCEADEGTILQPKGDGYRLTASRGVSPAKKQFLESQPFRPGKDTTIGRVLLDGKTIHIEDTRNDPDFRLKEPDPVRTRLGVPLLREGAPIGVFVLTRREARPFSAKQIELVQTFADQAVIAIENVRLFDEVQAKTRDLSESLQQQTATSEVLQIISSSPSDLAPLFDKMLENATRVCGAEFGSMLLVEDGSFRQAALYNAPAAHPAERANRVLQLHPQSAAAIAIRSKQVAQVKDARSSPTYLERNLSLVELVELGGARTVVSVPMLRDDEVIGVITVYRQEVRAFGDKQVELLSNFARQAVIAIENARLLRELRERTDDLTESLQFQTATSDVLRVISRSPDALQPVLDVIVETSRELCGSDASTIFLVRDGKFEVTAISGSLPTHLEHLKANPLPIGQSGSILARVYDQERTLHYANVLDDPELREGSTGLGGARALLVVPLMNDAQVIGAILQRQSHLRPFTSRQIQAIETFADQAVIAISNVSLFEQVQAKTRDLTEALVYQTGSSNILKVIASSPTDVGPALKAIVDSASEICDAYDSAVLLRDGDHMVLSAHHGPVPFGWQKLLINRRWISGRVVIDKVTLHVHDVPGPEGDDFPEGRELMRRDGVRTILSVPLLREDEAIGAIVLRRIEAQPFNDKQIELLKSFADQAVIAISNVRLFEQVQERTRELSRSLDDLRTAQDRLIQTEKLASLGQLTAGIAHEIKNPLNFVNNFSALSVELTDELNDILKQAELAEKIRKEVDELTGMLKDNLGKVVQHGKRADSIVKNMLLHSREGSGELRSADINALVEESLNLAYHGARAEKSGFEITLTSNLDPDAGAAELYPQEITRALLNLISNGFYAATQRKSEVTDDSFEPTLSAATKSLGNTVEIRIRDNGAGIPPDVKEKMFNPFFTTKPAGDGTGLGLSMSHDIVVKQHGGRIDVETEPGLFTEFVITLPRAMTRT
jgi:GAF domain-containing protein